MTYSMLIVKGLTMKTLDEVIKAMENCYGPDAECCDKCQYTKKNSAGSICLKCNLEDDALIYLKAYQWQMTNPDGDHLQLEKCRALLSDFYQNEPLSWDELRTMEGKPVWVECENFFCSQWVILTNVYDEKAMFIGDRIVDSELKEEMGDVWQAYRKERIDEA